MPDEFEDGRVSLDLLLATERGCGVVGVDNDPLDDLRESEAGLARWKIEYSS